MLKPRTGRPTRDMMTKVATASLSIRQHQVLTLYADGKRQCEIARELGINKRTVDTHRTIIFLKLGVHSMRQAIEIFTESRRAG